MLELKENKEFKNYKELCEFMGWKYSKGNQRKAQLKELETLCTYHKKGNKIIIDEVFNYKHKKKDMRSNKSVNYMENIENVIMGELILKGGDSEHYTIGKSELLKECGLINNNFTFCKQRPDKIAQYLKCNKSTVYEYFNLNNKSLISDMERALKNLKNMKLIQFNTIQMICKNNADVINYDHKIVIDEYEEQKDIVTPITINNLEYSIATEEERNIILKCEANVLKSMGYKNIFAVFANNRTKEYYNKMYDMVRKDIKDFQFYFTGYDITYYYDYIVEELNHRGFEDWFKEYKEYEQYIINDGTIDKINKNSKTRQKKAIPQMGILPKNNKNYYRTTKEYLNDINKLNNNVINLKADNIKNTIRKIKLDKWDT